MTSVVWKILRHDELFALQNSGKFAGSADDLRDGFIHLSTASQTAQTLLRHFTDQAGAGEAGLTLISFDADGLGENLRWEASRNGAMFPHFYGVLSVDQIGQSIPLQLNEAGAHILPEDFD